VDPVICDDRRGALIRHEDTRLLALDAAAADFTTADSCR